MTIWMRELPMATAQRWLNATAAPPGMSLADEIAWAAVGLVEDHATPVADRLAMVALLRATHARTVITEPLQPRLFNEIEAAIRKALTPVPDQVRRKAIP